MSSSHAGPGHSRPVIIKYGGAAMNNPLAVHEFLKSAVTLFNSGKPVILVHGGGPEIDGMLKRLNIEPKKKDGLRVTDDATMEVVEMVLAGKVNKSLVSSINALGGSAAGICGKDGKLIKAEKKSSEGTDLGRVGVVKSCHPEILFALLSAGIMPVVSSVAADAQGKALNINADEMAAALAAALKAQTFVLLTDVAGVLSNYPDEKTLINNMSRAEVLAFLSSGQADKGMKPKLQACLDAVNGGVSEAFISDGRKAGALCESILKGNISGTRIF